MKIIEFNNALTYIEASEFHPKFKMKYGLNYPTYNNGKNECYVVPSTVIWVDDDDGINKGYMEASKVGYHIATDENEDDRYWFL